MKYVTVFGYVSHTFWLFITQFVRLKTDVYNTLLKEMTLSPWLWTTLSHALWTLQSCFTLWLLSKVVLTSGSSLRFTCFSFNRPFMTFDQVWCLYHRPNPLTYGRKVQSEPEPLLVKKYEFDLPYVVIKKKKNCLKNWSWGYFTVN